MCYVKHVRNLFIFIAVNMQVYQFSPLWRKFFNAAFNNLHILIMPQLFFWCPAFISKCNISADILTADKLLFVSPDEVNNRISGNRIQPSREFTFAIPPVQPAECLLEADHCQIFCVLSIPYHTVNKE